MSSAIETIKGLTNTTPLQTYHAYIFGTAFWYSVRALCRIIDPAMVATWFRPPAQATLPNNLAVEPNDLELYNIRTDAWGLLALAAILLAVADA
ncbi:Peroxisomal membrane protein LPX1, partial [Teratosphaeria destructans]